MTKNRSKPHPENDPPEKPSSITEGVSNLIGSIAVTVKDAASVITDHIKSPAEVSNRVETAVPPVEENLDARPMTADEIAGKCGCRCSASSSGQTRKSQEARGRQKSCPEKRRSVPLRRRRISASPKLPKRELQRPQLRSRRRRQLRKPRQRRPPKRL